MSLLALLGVLSSAIFSGTSLLYTTLGEVISERGGIVNLGLEGVMLVSAAVGFGVTSSTGNPNLGVYAQDEWKVTPQLTINYDPAVCPPTRARVILLK